MLASLAHTRSIDEQNAWILTNAKPYTSTVESLARECGQSVQGLKAHLRELEDKKLISVTWHFDGRITFVLLPIGSGASRPKDRQSPRKTKRLRSKRKR